MRAGIPLFVPIDAALATELESQLLEDFSPERVLLNREPGEAMFTSKTVRVVCAAALLSFFAGSALAVEPPNKKDLTQGIWDLDLTKSRFCKPAPKKSRREIFDAGWGLIVVHWTGIDENGKAIDSRYVWRYDGEKYPAGIDSADAPEAMSWKLINPSRVEFVHWSKDNKLTEELVRTVSSDGQEMTQARKYLGAKAGGKAECVDTQVFKRQ